MHGKIIAVAPDHVDVKYRAGGWDGLGVVELVYFADQAFFYFCKEVFCAYQFVGIGVCVFAVFFLDSVKDECLGFFFGAVLKGVVAGLFLVFFD